MKKPVDPNNVDIVFPSSTTTTTERSEEESIITETTVPSDPPEELARTGEGLPIGAGAALLLGGAALMQAVRYQRKQRRRTK